MTETQKDARLQYMGKELKNHGTSVKGKDWKKFDVKFRFEDREQSNIFKAWDTIPFKGSLQLDDLKELEWYKVKWKEVPWQIPDGDEILLKEILGIYDKLDEDTTSTAQPGPPEVESFDEFTESYKAQNPDTKDVYHYILTYLVTQNPKLAELVGELKNQFKERIGPNE